MLRPTPLIRSGDVLSGQLDWPHLRSGLVSGLVQSGQIGSGQVASGHLASGLIGSLPGAVLTSGVIQSGLVGNAAVNSGNVGSGQIGWPHLSSGMVSGVAQSGSVGAGAVNSGEVGSGQLGSIQFRPNSIFSGTLFSTTTAFLYPLMPVRGGAAGDPPNIYPSSIGGSEIGSGQVGSGHIESGSLGLLQMRSGLLSGLVLSGQIGSGQLDWSHLRSGLVSGLMQSGGVGSGALSWVHLASGTVSGLVLSGQIGSGQVGLAHLRSGLVSGLAQSGGVGSGALSWIHLASGTVSGLIQSGQIGSGQVGRTHVASGAWITAVKGRVEQASGQTVNLLSGVGGGNWANGDLSGVNFPSIDLPGMGDYVVTAAARCTLRPTAANTNVFIMFRLFNTTTNLPISGSEVMGLLNNTNNRLDFTANCHADVTATSGHTIQLQGQAGNAGSGTLAQITSDGNGRTSIRYDRGA